MSRISLIVAMAENRVIGRHNGMPWHLPADLKRFRALTWGKPLLMGRRTHESIGRPLPGRVNIVLTADRTYDAEGCIVVNSLDEALAHARSASELMVIGGSSVYEALLPVADRLYQTLIHCDYEGDVWFPTYDRALWHESSRERVEDDPQFGIAYTFLVLDRSGPSRVASQQGDEPCGTSKGGF
jgi:dihydrofolate reductase